LLLVQLCFDEQEVEDVSSKTRPAQADHSGGARTLSFQLLGPLDISANGDAIQLDRQMPRTLLALLLVCAGEFVLSDWLVDELWTDEPPETARASLQNFVCQLRKVLGADVVLTGVQGYRLNVQPEQIDTVRFRQAAAAGRALAAPRSCAARLRAGLELWRGRAFEDVVRTPALELEASLLHEQRTSALEDAIDAELQLGYDADLVAELERLIADEPYRERLRAQLALALYRSGRQQEALDGLRQARRTLRCELGLEPSPPLRELERAILAQAPELASPRRRPLAYHHVPRQFSTISSLRSRRLRSILQSGPYCANASFPSDQRRRSQGQSANGRGGCWRREHYYF
jgi:DNA-binding SARP family transcriptional activator